MFDFDAGKLLLIGVVALIIIGPKDLPRVLRQLGQTVAKLRRMATEFQSQFMDAMREAELDDIRQDMTKLTDQAKLQSTFNPIQTVRRELTEAMADRSTEPPGAPSLGLSGLSEIAEATAPDLAAAGAVPIVEPAPEIAPEAIEPSAPPAGAKAAEEPERAEPVEPSVARRIGGV